MSAQGVGGVRSGNGGSSSRKNRRGVIIQGVGDVRSGVGGF